MKRNLKIIIGFIAIIILILILINIFKDNSNVSETIEEASSSNIQYDEDTGEYYIQDEETGEILHTGESEEELYIYTIDSDYDPKIPASDGDMENETIE